MTGSSLIGGSKGHKVAEVGRVLLRRLCIAMIQLAPARAGHVREQAMKNLSALLVDIQTQVEEVAQEAAGLGDAVAVGVVDPACKGFPSESEPFLRRT